MRNILCTLLFFFVMTTSQVAADPKEIDFTSIEVDPSPTITSIDIAVHAKLNAKGFEGTKVKLRLRILSLAAKVIREREDVFQLRQSFDNRVEMKIKAPDMPGEYKISLEIVDFPVKDAKKEYRIETYLSVTREGVRLLVLDRVRDELKFLRTALQTNRRIDWIEINPSKEDLTPDKQKRHEELIDKCDAVILGDITFSQIYALHPNMLEKLAERIFKQGVGLVKIGAYPNDDPALLVGIPIEKVLPVKYAKQAIVEGPIAFIPTKLGTSHFLLRLLDDPLKNGQVWERLNELRVTQLQNHIPIEKVEPWGNILATARSQQGREAPLLITGLYGRGRVIVVATDQTWKWVNLGAAKGGDEPSEGQKLHTRFWTNVVQWLTYQEEGSIIRIVPRFRRSAVDDANVFRLILEDQDGLAILNPQFSCEISTIDNLGRKSALPVSINTKGEGIAKFTPTTPGEYRLVVRGSGRTKGGREIESEAATYFIVIPKPMK